MFKLASLFVIFVLFDVGWTRTINIHRGDSARSPATEECIQKGQNGDCDFYQCFEQRHPCVWNNFAIRHGWTFCRRLDEEYVNLTPEGKRWLNDTRQCAMGTMLAYYRSDRRQCRSLEQHMVGVHSSCSVQMGICNADLLLANREVLLRVYTFSPEVVEKLLSTLEHCGEESIQPIVDWLKQAYATAVDHTSALLDEVPSVEDVRRRLPTKDEILRQLPTTDQIRALLPSNEELAQFRSDVSKLGDEIANALPSRQDISKLGDDIVQALPSRQDISKLGSDISRALPSRHDIAKLGNDISRALPSGEDIKKAVPSRDEIVNGLRSGEQAVRKRLPSRQQVSRAIAGLGKWFD